MQRRLKICRSSPQGLSTRWQSVKGRRLVGGSGRRHYRARRWQDGRSSRGHGRESRRTEIWRECRCRGGSGSGGTGCEVAAGVQWRSLKHSRGARSASEVFGPIEKDIRWDDHLRLHLVAKRPVIAYLARHQVLRDEVQRRDLVPGSRYPLLHGLRFEAILDQSNGPGAVVREVAGDRRGADCVIVHVDECTRWIAADGHPPPDTSRQTDAESDCQKDPQTGYPKAFRQWIGARWVHYGAVLEM